MFSVEETSEESQVKDISHIFCAAENYRVILCASFHKFKMTLLKSVVVLMICGELSIEIFANGDE